MSGLDRAVLVLNRSWVAVNVASVRRAMSLLYRGLAQVVHPADFSTYDFSSWTEASQHARGDYIRTLHYKIRIPEIIILTRYSGFVKRKVAFNRRTIFERDGYRCQYCGAKMPMDDLTLDHVTPRSRGGHSTWDNIVVACVGCNTRKANKLPQEAGMSLLKKPGRPKWPAHSGVRVVRGLYASWERFLSQAYWDTELSE
ncbi:MAG TPA: HNH endonuclease [Planctomycetes bacterium]|nr:HNH endonuclease [Planctomycetota bacterium]